MGGRVGGGAGVYGVGEVTDEIAGGILMALRKEGIHLVYLGIWYGIRELRSYTIIGKVGYYWRRW